MFTINYQYWSLQFVKEGEKTDLPHAVAMDDSDLEACFAALTDGEQDVVVRSREGYMRRLLEYLKKRYIMIKAAGGVVSNSSGELLLMTRNERADLPKGKVEPGETLAEAALRETSEETGLRNVELGLLLLKSYHIYDLYGGWHFKQTSWFRMKVREEQKLVPQLEEQITDVEWVAEDVWCRRLNESYATMRSIVSKIVKK